MIKKILLAGSVSLLSGAFFLFPHSSKVHDPQKKTDPYATLRAFNNKFTPKENGLKNLFQFAQNVHLLGNAFAASQANLSAYDSIRSGVGFVIGYRAHAAYVKYACRGTDPGEGKECDGPPKDGMAGIVANMVKTLPQMLEGNGYNSCSSIPKDGTSKKLDDDLTVTFKAGTQTIPSGWEGEGEKYTHRMEFSMSMASSAFTVALETKCGVKTAAVFTKMEVGSQAPGYYRGINVFLGKLKNSEDIRGHIFVSEHEPSANTNRASYSFLFNVNESSKIFKIWGSFGSWYNSSSIIGMDYIAAHGSYGDTRNLSVFFRRIITPQSGSNSNRYTDASTLGSDSYVALGSNSDSVVTATQYDLLTDLSDQTTAGTVIKKQGCINLDTEAAPTSAELCSGMALSDPVEKPTLDSTGNWAPYWAVKTAYSKLVGIP